MVTPSSSIKALLLCCLATASLHATTIRYWNYTKKHCAANLSMIIHSLDATDVTYIAPNSFVDRFYDKDYVRFLRLVIEDENGKTRTFNHPFNDTFYDMWTVNIYPDYIQISAPF